MENPSEIRTDQKHSVFGIEQYPGPSTMFQFNPNVSSTRFNDSNVCSNPQFQNIAPFATSFQEGTSFFQSSFPAVSNAQNQQFLPQNIPQSPQFPQFDTSNSSIPFPRNGSFNSPFNTPLNITQSSQFNSSKSSNLFDSNMTFNIVRNMPQFDPPKVTNSFSFGSMKSDSLVQFPFADGGFGVKSKQFRGKRRTDLAELENASLPPTKQHITEEKMAEHMSRLHINSETTPTNTETESVKNKRLYMCEEMRKLQTDPILPPCLLRQKPCTALVLWQPPNKVLSIAGSSGQNNNNNNEEDSTENNNENRLLDQNVMDEVEFEQNSILNTMEMDV